MGSRKLRFFVIFLGLFHVLVGKGLAGRHGVGGFLLSSHHLLDEEKVQEMWRNCGLDLLVIREQVRTSSFSFPNIFHDTNEISSERRSHSSRSIREAIYLLSPKVNRSFLDCLSEQNFPLHMYGEDGLRNCFVDYLESLLSQRPTSRRSLVDQSSQPPSPESAPSPSPSPSPSPTPTPTPPPTPPPTPTPSPTPTPTPTPTPSPSLSSFSSPSPTPTPTPTPSPYPSPSPSSSPAAAAVGAHASAPAKRPGHGPPDPPRSSNSAPREKRDPYDDLFGNHAPGSSNSPDVSGNTRDSPPVAPAKKNDSNNETVVIAVVLTAIGTSLFFAILFFCYGGCRDNSNYTAESRKDDSPLPTSTSQQSFGTNRVGTTSLKTDTNKKYCNASLGTSSVVAAATSEVLQENSDSSAKTSETPGNVVASKPPPPPPVMPPPFLKPPPPPPPPPPSPPPPPKTAPCPPGPPKAAFPLRKGNPGCIAGKKLSPLGPKASPSPDFQFDAGSGKTKLKPFFWDKVNARPDQPMVWDNLKAGSFQFNEEMIETLFGVTSEENRGDGRKESAFKEPSPQYVRILDPKKSQNLAISLRALNVKTEEVCEALTEGNELPSELLQLLMKMAPSTEEELKLRLHSDTSQLGPAEQFLKALVEIPFAFQRMEVLLFMSSLPEDLSGTAESFSTLEVACQELRSSRLFSKLLEAVLKTGNRMNDGTFRGGAQAFKLDTLLKLADVKGTDGKTTLLHFVVQEIVRSEGVRAARMHGEGQLGTPSLNFEDLADDVPTDSGDYFRSLGLRVVSGLGSELENVKKAAGFDADALTGTAAHLGERLLKTKEFLETRMGGIEESQFLRSLKGFVGHAEAEITGLLEEERRIRLLVKDTADYFHGDTGKEEGLRLFVTVRDFLAMLDKVCKQVRDSEKAASRTSRTRATTPLDSPARDPSADSPARDLPTMSPARDPRQLLFPAIRDRRMEWSSSDEDDDDEKDDD